MLLKRATYTRLLKNNLGSLFNFINLSFIQGSNAVIQILLFPIIIHIVGLAEFGHVMVANSYATLVGLLINYGSNQSGIKDVAIGKSDTKMLAATFYTIFYSRGILFLISLIILPILFVCHVPGIEYFLFANTIIFAEVVNPFFFFIGVEKLFLYNITNLIAKICSACAIIFFVRSSGQSYWVNFYLGVASATAYLAITILLIGKYELAQYWNGVSIKQLRRYFGINFYLAANNLSVQLQQSFFLFTVSATGDALVLGAYSLCDKLVWSFRILIISFSNAIYPRAVNIFYTNKLKWKRYKRQINIGLAIVFFIVAVVLFFFPSQVVWLFTGKYDALSVIYIRSACLVPLIMALNSLNVMDLLMRNEYKSIFKIAVALFIITVSMSLLLSAWHNTSLFGYYPVIVEISSLPLSLYFISKSDKKYTSSAHG
jgi:O-antigen/teichoic acid export membrane protein